MDRVFVLQMVNQVRFLKPHLAPDSLQSLIITEPGISTALLDVAKKKKKEHKAKVIILEAPFS